MRRIKTINCPVTDINNRNLKNAVNKEIDILKKNHRILTIQTNVLSGGLTENAKMMHTITYETLVGESNGIGRYYEVVYLKNDEHGEKYIDSKTNIRLEEIEEQNGKVIRTEYIPLGTGYSNGIKGLIFITYEAKQEIQFESDKTEQKMLAEKR